MYSVSDEYKVAVADSHRKSKMRGVLTVGNNVINLNDSDIIKDSVYISNQCTNGSEFEYGCVYCAECGITIKSTIDRYSLYDAELKLFWSLWTGSAWEEIPLGVYYISEPNRINDKITIKALDRMTLLDKNVDEDTTGTMKQLLAYISEKCGVELAQTDEELDELVNSNALYSVYSDKVETYRDLLAYICMMSAAFGTFDRNGKLKVVPYATDTCVTLTRKHRFSNASFSDYTTSFVGIKARFIAEENYAPYEAGETGNGLILDMGDNPIVRGLPETKHALLENVYNVLRNVRYTPFEIETLSNPAIELGDLVSNTEVGKDGKTYVSPVTYYYWTYRGKYKLRAVGGNPKLSGISNKQGKQVSVLEGGIESKSVIVKNYSNADTIKFNSTEAEIATFNYSAIEESKLILLLTLRFTASLDGVINIKFYTDAALDSSRIFKQYVQRGDNIVTISELYTAETNDRHNITIKANMEYFESDKRKQDADITTYNNFLAAINKTAPTVQDNVVLFPTYKKGVIDTSIATATIEKGGIKAILYGQGITSNEKWDGTINYSEALNRIDFNGHLVLNVKDNMSLNRQTPVGDSVGENINREPFNGILTFRGNVTDNIAFDLVEE